jgi:outer membrane receptor protein involved in Fe transport
VTGGTGSFLFPALIPGEYNVTVIMDSFVTRELKDVRVVLDQITRLSFEMTAASFAGEVVVSGETPVINVTNTALGQSYSEEFLQGTAIGSTNRDFNNAIGKTAGVFKPSGVLGGGYLATVSVFGSAGDENAYYIDGLSNNQPITNTFNSKLNFDAIDEMSVQTGGYNAEFGFAVGGVFNLVTKSGGNRFSGTVDARYIGEDFSSSSEHFDSDSLFKYQSFAATLGGPIVSDKLWFFASYETYAQDRRPSDVEQTNEEDRNTGLIKLTWQAGDAWRVVWKSNLDDWTNFNAIALPFIMPEADASDERRSETHQLEALGSLSDSLFLNLQIGTTANDIDLIPASGDFDTLGHVDAVTSVYSVNWSDVQIAEDGRDEFRGDLSWFVDDFGGSHQFKVGVDLQQVFFKFDRFAPGGGYYFDFLGTPYAFVQQERFVGDYDGDYRTAFVQDSWRPHPNLTLNFGVRYDRTSYDVNPEGEQIADMDQVQPRLGVAWDATGDGKTVVRGFWGEFMHPAAMTLPNLTKVVGPAIWAECAAFGSLIGVPIPGDPASCEALAGAFGLPYRDDPGDYPGTGWLLFQPPTSGGAVVEDGLQGPVAEQLTLGIEREVFRNSSLSLQYIDKKTDRFYDTTCNGNIPEPDANGDCSYFVVTNSVPAERDYTGWVLTFESRAVKNFSLLASYVYSKSKGSIATVQGQSPDFDYYPENFVNRYGYMDDHRDHQLKINGFWLMPLRFTLGFDFNYRSEMPWTPMDSVTALGRGTVFVEPRGSGEGDSFYQMDLQLSKGFALGGTWDLQLILSVLNVTNAENGLDVCEDAVYGCFVDNQQVPAGSNTDWQLPRRFELGVRITF